MKKVRPIVADPFGPEDATLPSTPEQWEHRREELRNTILQYLGEFPSIEPPLPHYQVLEKHDESHYQRMKIAYEVEPGEEVRAWLLVPPREKRKNAAAILCLHGTSPEAKDTQLGLGRRQNRGYGMYLAMNGYITLSPDHCCAGERLVPGYKPYDSEPFYARHPSWSMVGKAIWDGQRALDILSNTEGVDAARLGAVGHSLGGHGSMFVSAFDSRVRAAVCSCGLTTWVDNPQRLNWSRDRWYKYIPPLREVFLADEGLPFEMYDFAALIAPRAFLNISGMTDPGFGNNETWPEMGRQLHNLWQLVGHPEGFANFLMGAGHDVPQYSRALTLGWFDHWLAGET